MPPGKRRAPVPAPKFARLPPEGGLRLRGARGTIRASRAAAVALRPCPAPAEGGARSGAVPDGARSGPALHWRPIPQSGERAMAKTRGTGLLMVWTDIDAGHEAEFNRWYEEEHIARLLLSGAERRPQISGDLRTRRPRRAAQRRLSRRRQIPALAAAAAGRGRPH